MGEHDGHRKRLRTRFLERGPEALQDAEILELLLFYALPRQDTYPIAEALLDHFGTIAAVLDASRSDLKAVAGIGDAAAALLYLINPLAKRYLLSRSVRGAALTTTQACGEYLLPYFFGAKEELVYVLCLNARCEVLGCQLIQRGGLNSASFSVRSVVEAAIGFNANSVVLAHNHTSGVALPSQADYEATRCVRDILTPLDILLADHIIVADNDFISLADSGFFG